MELWKLVYMPVPETTKIAWDALAFSRVCSPLVVHLGCFVNRLFDIEVPGFDALGRPERKEHMLAENDDIWEELQHKHFAAASAYINEKFDEFRTKNKAAGYKVCSANLNE